MATQDSSVDGETVAVFDAVSPGTPLTTSEVASRLDVTRRGAYDRLESLVEDDCLETKKVGAKGRVWWRSPAAAAAGDGTDGSSNAPAGMFDRLLDNVPGLVYRCANEPGARMTFVSEGAEAVCGYTPAEFEAGAVTWGGDVMHPEDKPRVRQVIAEGVAQAGTFALEYRIRTAEDDRRWVRERGCVVSPEKEELEGLITDVTDQKRTEAALESESAFIDAQFDAQPDIVYAVGPDGGMERWNDRLVGVTGYDDEEIGAMHATDFFPDRLGDRIREELAAVREEGQSRSVELPLQTADGDRIPYEFTGARITAGDGTVVGVTGVGRDISDRKALERRLRSERDRFESELAEVFDRVDDAFFAVDEDFRFTYVNDRVASLLERSRSTLLGEILWEAVPEASETRAWDQFHEALQAQESRHFELSYEPLPFWAEVHAYPSASGLSVYVRDVTDRKQRERELERQRQRLAALNDLHDVVRRINQELATRSSREEIERTVCRRLAATDTYEFAWLGESLPDADGIVPRVEAGVDGFVDAVPLSAPSSGPGPVDRAIRSKEIQTTGAVRSDPDFAAWAGAAEAFAFRSVAVVPIVHAASVYGVLAIFAAHEDGFTGEERSVLAGLGETVGHAIAAVERKQALTSEQVVELELSVTDRVDDVDLGLPPDEAVTVRNFVPLGDGAYVAYGTTTPAGYTALGRLVGALPAWESVADRARENGTVRYELHVAEPPVVEAVTSHGGRLREATFTEEEVSLRVLVSPTTDVRKLVEAVQRAAPQTELVGRQQHSRDAGGPSVLSAVTEELTERQRAALEASYRAGYFEWPRDSTGADVATALGVSEPTFQQHLRRATAKVLATVFD